MGLETSPEGLSHRREDGKEHRLFSSVVVAVTAGKARTPFVEIVGVYGALHTLRCRIVTYMTV